MAEEEALTFDEILEDPEYKAEFDRRVTKALSTVQKKLDAEVKKNKALSEKYGSEDEDGDITAVRQQVKDLQKELGDRDYAAAIGRAIENAADGKGLKFTSKSAREAFEAALKAKGLELKDGELEGFDDFVEARRKADPDAFAKDEKAEKDKGDGTPRARFTTRTRSDGKDQEPMTREKIMEIKDRAARRKTIAENMELFENNKEDT